MQLFKTIKYPLIIITLAWLNLGFTVKYAPNSCLKEATVLFGIPRTTDDEWDGGHILRIVVNIFLNDGTKFSANQEYRNNDIKKNRAIGLIIPFEDSVKKKITFENIKLINIQFFSFQGVPSDIDGNKCRFRNEGVFKFNNDKVILTGIPDAQLLLPTGKFSKIERFTDRKHFESDITKALKDGDVN